MNAEIGQGHGYEPGVGALLRASRLRRGEELQDIAALLRIRYPFLEAIEDGRYQELPGSAYAIGFVRTYAEHLGLDSEEVVRRFKAEAENLERRSDLVFPSPIAERSTPGGAIVFVGILMAAVAYGAWYLGTSKQSFLDDLVSPLPDRLTAMIRGDGEAPTTTPSTMPPEATGGAPSSAPEAAAPAAPASPPPAGQTVAPPADTPAPAPSPSQPPASTAPVPSPQPQVSSKPVTVPPPTPIPPAVAPVTPAAPSEPSQTPPVARVEPPASEPRAPAASPVRPTPPAPAVATPPAVSAPSEVPASPPAPPPAPPAAPATTQVQPPVPPAATAEGPAAEQTAIPTDAPADTSSRIVVRAKLDSWIQVRDGVGRRLLVTRLLRAGETYQVPNQPSLSLLTGNAGGLEILVDGEPVPAIGDVGAVRRDVTLEADRLKAGTAVVD
ncbi:MAG: DUF4115 domain-containing protein [Rhodospirillales bacterium]|nr:DUF4115 domain-containing protein [Rhodospirillales bacterium]